MGKNNKLQAGSDHAGSSSSSKVPKKGSEQLSKNEIQKLNNWVKNLVVSLEKPTSTVEEAKAVIQDVGEKLEQYKAAAQTRSDIIMTALLSHNNGLKGYKSLTHLLLAKILLQDPAIPEKNIQYEKFKGILKLFMSYGAKPSKGEPIAVVFEIYSELQIKYFEKKSNTYRHKDLIEIMSSDPEIFNMLDENQNSLIICAATCGDIEAISYILSLRPDLLNHQYDMKQSVLLSLMLGNNDNETVIYIEKHKPNLNQLYDKGFTMLQGAIQQNLLKTVEVLLKSRCRIDSAVNSLIPKSPALLELLGKSGYFLCADNKNPIDESEPYFIISGSGLSEKISSVEDLNNSTIIPCEDDIIRLHYSFKELIEKDSVSDHINELYQVFSKKFPANLEPVPEFVDKPVEIDLAHNAIRFTSFFKHAIHFILKADDEHLFSYIHTATDYLSEPDVNSYDVRTLKDVIIDLNESLPVVMKDAGSTDSQKSVAFMISFSVATKLIPLIVSGGNESVISEVFYKVSNILYCANTSVRSQFSSADSLNYVLDSLISYGRKNEPASIYLKYLSLIKMSLNIGDSMRFGFYKEIVEQFDSINNFDDVIGSSLKDKYTAITLMSMIYSISKNMTIDRSEINYKLNLIKRILTIIERIFEYDIRGYGASIVTARTNCHEKLTILEGLYFAEIDEKLKNEDNARVYRYNKGKSGLHIDFNDKFDPKKLSEIVTNFHMVKLSSRGLCVMFSDFDLDDIIAAISCIQAIDPKSIMIEAPVLAETKSIDADNSSQKEFYHLPSPPSFTTKSITYMRSSCKSEGSSSLDVKTMITPPSEEVIEPIKAVLRERLGLAQGVMLYNLYNKPEINDNRRHLFWAIWFENILHESSDFIPDTDLVRFNDLLEDGGKFASSALNKHGLRSATVHDAATNKDESSFKLKLASKGARIYAVPIQVPLNNREVLNVYCFGVPVKHKTQEKQQNVVKVDSRKFYLK